METSLRALHRQVCLTFPKPVNPDEKVMVKLKQLAIAVNTCVVMEQSSPIHGARSTISKELISSLQWVTVSFIFHSET